MKTNSTNLKDKSHDEQIGRWAIYVRDNPHEWKKQLKPFLDSQILIARRFYNNLSKTEEGRKKIELLIKNKKEKK